MSITLQLATPDLLEEIVEAVAVWQQDGVPVQLHPGDLGWNWSLGAQELAEAIRVWRRDGEMLAVGMVDEAELIRMAIAPSVGDDDAFAVRVLADLVDPGQGVFPVGVRIVEARFGSAFRDLLRRSGGRPMRRGPRCVVTSPHQSRTLASGSRSWTRTTSRVGSRCSGQCSSTRKFTLERWHTMAAASPYRRARCLVGYDANDESVTTVTVWSAGQGRRGLLEPLGVHRDHRGHGYGTAITVGAAAALQQLGSCSATVCTPSANVGGVATYVSAGFQRLPDVTDFRRTT